jgi:hypothetical protein
MLTHADMATAVGMPPVEVESLDTGGALGDTDTHTCESVPPGAIEENDIYQVGPGDFRTVAQRVELGPGEWALHFRHPFDGVRFRVVVDELEVRTVTVYRPKGARS